MQQVLLRWYGGTSERVEAAQVDLKQEAVHLYLTGSPMRITVIPWHSIRFIEIE